MSCIMKYRVRGSDNRWQYYEDSNEQGCRDCIMYCEFKEDVEYEIYQFSTEGVVWGRENY